MQPPLFAALVFAAVLPAQQVITLEIEGKASGLDLWSNRSVTRVTVGDAATLTFRFNPGDTPAIVAQRIAAGVGAQGFAALATGNSVRIVPRQNGTPPQQGVDFGTNDTGHTGIIATCDGAGPSGSVKTNGCTLPYVVGGPTDPRGIGGTIYVDVDVERPGPAGQVWQRTSLPVRYGPNQMGWQVSALVIVALVGAGFDAHGVTMWSPLNQIGTTHDGIQVDRDIDGYPVRRIAYQPATLPFDMRWMEVHAGRQPVFGTTDYGQPWNDVPGLPLRIVATGVPRLGVACGARLETGIPNQFCLLLLGWERANIALPMLGAGADLVVDPAGSVLQSGIATANGAYGFGGTIPGNPVFLGVTLCWQGADMSPFGAAPRLSPGLVQVIG